MKVARRTSLKLLLAAPTLASWVLPKLSLAQAGKLKATPQDVEGPYYPTSWEGEVDNDLTFYKGKPYNGGIPMALGGLVRGENAEPVAHARVEIWQIDDVGEYRHPNFGGERPAERGFQGYGRGQVDKSGRYAFKTIKPIGYGGRPPHVHFRVVAQGYQTLTTEMYFVGDNAEGSLWQRLFGGFSSERDLLSVTPKEVGTASVPALEVAFDIVLARA